MDAFRTLQSSPEQTAKSAALMKKAEKAQADFAALSEDEQIAVLAKGRMHQAVALYSEPKTRRMLMRAYLTHQYGPKYATRRLAETRFCNDFMLSLEE